MKHLVILVSMSFLIGCNHHVYFHHDQEFAQDTIIIRDTVVPAVIIIRDTLLPDTVMLTEKVIEMPLNPWPGIILPFSNIRKDTIYKVWVQWGFMGPWHQYLLNDTVR